MTAQLTLERATALCYRIFDVGEEVDLERARALVSSGTRRLKLTREGGEYIQFANPPLAVELGTHELGARKVQVSAHIFAHGALSIITHVEIPPGTSLEALIPFADELYDSQEIEKLSEKLMKGVRDSLVPAIRDPHLWETNESYTVLWATKLCDGATREQLLASPALPRLLLGEAKEPRLSEAEARDVLSHQFSYSGNDLVVIDWNAAFVLEPSGSTDIPDLLEIANSQLLEFRYYDAVLDLELSRVYDEIEKKKRGTLLFSPYKKLMRQLMLTLIELSEFIERVENSLRIVGDVYLARVYEAAVEQLRVQRWQAQVTRKQRLLAQTYALLKGEIDTGRALTLEVMVVVLIILELVVALTGLLPH